MNFQTEEYIKSFLGLTAPLPTRLSGMSGTPAPLWSPPRPAAEAPGGLVAALPVELPEVALQEADAT